MTPAHRHLVSRVGALLLATIALDVVGSALVYQLERHARGTGIHTPGDALFWTSTQLTTVSSQLPNPASSAARILDVVLQAYAICAVAILAGSFGAFFHGRHMEQREGLAPPDVDGARPSGNHAQAAAVASNRSAARSSETAPRVTSTRTRPSWRARTSASATSSSRPASTSSFLSR